jgi:hypothetical protein
LTLGLLKARSRGLYGVVQPLPGGFNTDLEVKPGVFARLLQFLELCLSGVPLLLKRFDGLLILDPGVRLGLV